MSQPPPKSDADDAARQSEIDELAGMLEIEFEAVTLAAGRLRERSKEAKLLDDDDLLAVLSQLRVARAVDDLTMTFLDVKEQEAEAAAHLLDELESDEYEDFDEFDDQDFEDEDYEDDYEDEDEEDGEDGGDDDFGSALDEETPR